MNLSAKEWGGEGWEKCLKSTTTCAWLFPFIDHYRDGHGKYLNITAQRTDKFRSIKQKQFGYILETFAADDLKHYVDSYLFRNVQYIQAYLPLNIEIVHIASEWYNCRENYGRQWRRSIYWFKERENANRSHLIPREDGNIYEYLCFVFVFVFLLITPDV